MSENSLRLFGNFDKKLTNRLSVFMEKGIFFKKSEWSYGICMEKTHFFCGITIWKNMYCLCMMDTIDITIG